MGIGKKTRLETAPYEAGKRIKFAGFGESNYKSREIGEALKILEHTMLIYLLYPTTSVKIPAIRNIRKAPRLQFIDTGMLNYVVRLQENYFSYQDLHSFYRGMIAEQIVGQELLCNSIYNEKPLFWVREKKQSTAEVDYLIQYRKYLIPLEVKSATSGRLRSLHQFVDRCDHAYAVRLYAGPLNISKEHTISGKQFTLLNMPYFLVSEIFDYLNWMMTEV